MLEKGDKVILPNGNPASVQGWAIELSIARYPGQKPYKKSSRKQALASGSPMVEVWNMTKPSTDPTSTEYWPLDSVKVHGN